MKYKSLYITLIVILILCGLGVLWWSYSRQSRPPVSPPAEIQVKSASFSDLPGWQSSQSLSSLHTFQVSCRQFLNMKPHYSVGNTWFGLEAQDWQPICKAAVALQTESEDKAKAFFETWFEPVEFSNNQSITGLFTGYYLPAVQASITKTHEYSVPVFGVPDNLLRFNLHDFDRSSPSRQVFGRLDNKRVVPFFSRADIDQGAIARHAPVLAYLRNPIDRLLIEIQGSAVLILPDGRQLNLGYAGKNGLPYTAIGRVLIERKILAANQVSVQSIRAYLEAHPDEQNEIIQQNRSFVFFKILSQKGAFGTLGIPLTQGYSLAVDPDWVPLGMPVWLSTTYPDPDSNQQHPFHRLMIAQDTGGAIKGTVRGDVFWGKGNKAAAIAGKMKSQGRYWLLVPKHSDTAVRIATCSRDL